LHADGSNFTQIVMLLAIAEGYTTHYAQRVVETVLEGGDDVSRLMNDADLLGRPMPRIDTSKDAMHIELPDRQVRVVMEQWAPRIVLLDSLLSEQECDAVCELARGSLSAARVYDSLQGHNAYIENARKAEVAILEMQDDPLIATIEQRIEALTGWAHASGESLLVQRYAERGKFDPHFDFFLEQSSYYARSVENGGQRLATLIVYLQPPERGGATYMANLGLRVMPKKGSALFFSYPVATKQSGTRHAGEPVLSGEKWIMTKWFREKPLL
jgi:prolyl 4-hydroxylase